jgi:hypothetical protein
MHRSSPLSRIQALAQDQWGLVTRRQLRETGLGPTTVDRLTAPGGTLERVAYGVYQVAEAPVPDHQGLRAAWLQLAPEIPAWERTPAQGIVSHRSAAAVLGLGHLPADQHEFTLAGRHQSRRPDVHIHKRPVSEGEWVTMGGLPVTRPSRIAADLLQEKEDPEAVGQIITEALRRNDDYPRTFAAAFAPHAAAYGFRRDDGLALLRWLLDLTGDPERSRWIDEARRGLTTERARG